MKMLQITNPDPEALARMNDQMTQAGQAANEQAARVAFADHTARKAGNTIRRKIADLALFEMFLQSAGVPAAGLYDNPGAWRGITWGIVEAFRNWQLQQGYAVGSINGRLSTVRTFAKIAAKAGAISAQDSTLIGAVEGYRNKEAKHIDAKRKADGLQIRKGAKKAEAVTIPEDIVQALKAQPATPQGKRDTLIMCLLLDHGLRDSEIAILTRQSFDMKAGTFTFYRDMRFVKQAFEAAGYQLLYSRKKEQPGYYLNGQLALSSEFKQVLKSSATEVDQRQIDIYRKLSFAERFYQGCSLSDTARKVVAYRIRQENPRVSLAEANRMALQRAYSQRRTNLWSLPVSSG